MRNSDQGQPITIGAIGAERAREPHRKLGEQLDLSLGLS
jgi:hypothetical protein